MGNKPGVDSVQAAALLVQRRMLAHDGTCLQVITCYAKCLVPTTPRMSAA